VVADSLQKQPLLSSCPDPFKRCAQPVMRTPSRIRHSLPSGADGAVLPPVPTGVSAQPDVAVITLQNVSQTAEEPEVPKCGARRSRNAGQTSVAPASAGTGRTWALASARAEGSIAIYSGPRGQEETCWAMQVGARLSRSVTPHAARAL